MDRQQRIDQALRSFNASIRWKSPKISAKKRCGLRVPRQAVGVVIHDKEAPWFDLAKEAGDRVLGGRRVLDDAKAENNVEGPAPEREGVDICLQHLMLCVDREVLLICVDRVAQV